VIIDCDGIAIVFLALALAALAACHFPDMRRSGKTVGAGLGVLFAVIAALLSLLC
jgi:lipopolysaccharide export LptBFGC system permease protein LptF